MNDLIPFRDSEFEKASNELSGLKVFSRYINEIVQIILDKRLNKNNLDEILKKFNIKDISDIKEETLDLLLLYISFILDDNIITNTELTNLKVFKRLFKIKEGDFYKLKHDKIQTLLNKQFERIYEDKVVNQEEAILKVGMQELFDLGYDQFQELSLNEIKSALERGADLNDLDTVVKLTSNKSN